MQLSEETVQQLITQVANANAKLTLIQHDVRKLPALSEDIAVVKSQILALLGNGQPGRIARMEEMIVVNDKRAREAEQKLHTRISEKAEIGAFFQGKLAGVAVITGSLSGFLALILEAMKFLKGMR